LTLESKCSSGWVRFIYGLEAEPELLSRLFGNSKANSHFVYTHGHLKDDEVLEFIERYRGSCGVYQNLMVMMSGDTREQL
jgi:hypothetical protein